MLREFYQGLKHNGYVDCESVAIEYRWPISSGSARYGIAKVSFYVLSPEYYGQIMPGRLVGRAKILHRRSTDYEKLAAHLNAVVVTALAASQCRRRRSQPAGYEPDRPPRPAVDHIAVRPAIFDRDVSTLHISGLTQALTELAHMIHE
jgi:hypothetical protein